MHLPLKKQPKDRTYLKGRFTKGEKLLVRLCILLRDLYSMLKNGQAYVFDTNMLISDGALDKRYDKFFTINRNFWATETAFKEANSMLQSGGQYRAVFGHRLKMLSFEDIRRHYPNSCPIYYNLIKAMHNPAVVWSENFSAELIVKTLIKNRGLNKSEIDLNKTISRRLSQKRSATVETNLHDLLRRINVNNLSKKRTGIRKADENYFNDYKSLALALLYCLQKRRNTTFITADGDYLSLMVDIFSTIIQQFAMTHEVLQRLDDDKKKELLGKRKLTLFLNSLEFKKIMDKYSNDFFADNWKKDYLIFKIKYWNIKDQEYNLFEFRFDEMMREVLLNSHGSLSCPFVKNNDYGKWIGCRYWWPPDSVHSIHILKVVASAKNTIRPANFIVDQKVHTVLCRSSQEDKNNNYRYFSNFS